jgi:phenylacetate-CoA ligase
MKMKNNAIFEPKIECTNKKAIQKIQLKKFNNILNICKKSNLYSKINLPKKINNLEEVREIPFTTKQMLRNSYPYGSLCVDKNRVIEIHTSSGTTGNPTIMFLTKKDLETSNKVLARTWFCNGVRKEDIFMMMGDYGLFTGGLLNHYALIYIGTMVIPIGVSSSEKQITFLRI